MLSLEKCDKIRSCTCPSNDAAGSTRSKRFWWSHPVCGGCALHEGLCLVRLETCCERLTLAGFCTLPVLCAREKSPPTSTLLLYLQPFENDISNKTVLRAPAPAVGATRMRGCPARSGGTSGYLLSGHIDTSEAQKPDRDRYTVLFLGLNPYTRGYNNGPSLGIYIHDLLIGIYTTSFPNSVLFPTNSAMIAHRLHGFLSVGTTDEIDAMIQWLSFIHEFGRWQQRIKGNFGAPSAIRDSRDPVICKCVYDECITDIIFIQLVTDGNCFGRSV